MYFIDRTLHSNYRQTMDSKIDTAGLNNAPAINEEMKMKMTGLEGRLEKIEIELNGIKTNRKAIFGLSCLCFVILITNINWYDLYHGSKYTSIYWFKNLPPTRLLLSCCSLMLHIFH